MQLNGIHRLFLSSVDFHGLDTWYFSDLIFGPFYVKIPKTQEDKVRYYRTDDWASDKNQLASRLRTAFFHQIAQTFANEQARLARERKTVEQQEDGGLEAPRSEEPEEPEDYEKDSDQAGASRRWALL